MNYYESRNPRLEHEAEKEYYERIARLIEDTVDKRLREAEVKIVDKGVWVPRVWVPRGQFLRQVRFCSHMKASATQGNLPSSRQG